MATVYKFSSWLFTTLANAARNSKLVYNVKDSLKLTDIASLVNADVELSSVDTIALNYENYSVGTICSRAFYGLDHIEQINIPAVNCIYDYAFCNCSNLKSISFGYCYFIGDNAFNGCNTLSSIYGSNVHHVGECAFKDCISLSSITLSSVESFGSNAFAGCTNSVIEISGFTGYNEISGVFAGTGSNCTVAFTDLKYMGDIFHSSDEYAAPNNITVKFIGSSIVSYGSYSENDGKLDGVKSIYVDSSLLTAYKTSFPWSNFSNKIYAYN